jgi:hypothetical protein
MENERQIQILLVDDHPIVRKGTKEMLEPHPDLLVIGEAADGREALAFVGAPRRDFDGCFDAWHERHRSHQANQTAPPKHCGAGLDQF